jgi:hypothetical protein
MANVDACGYISVPTSSDIVFSFKEYIRDHHDSSGKILIKDGIEIYKTVRVIYLLMKISLTAYRQVCAY